MSYDILRRLAPFLFPGGRVGSYCLLGCYLDDSADLGRKTVFSVAGFLGQEPEWFELARKFERRVKKDGIGYFKTYEYKTMSGEFQKLADRYGLTTARVLADAMFNDLKDLIHKAPMAAYCFAVPMEEFRDTTKNPDAKLVLTEDPYFAAHQQIITLAASDVCQQMKTHRMVAFVYDDHSKAAALQASWAEFKEKNPVMAECMSTLAPLNDKECPPLQIADIIANVTTEVFVAGRNDPERAEAVIREWLPHLQIFAHWTKEFLLKYVVPGNIQMAKQKATQANDQFKNFDATMRKLIAVPHSELKAALDAEKAAKKRKPKTSASGRASRDKAN